MGAFQWQFSDQYSVLYMCNQLTIINLVYKFCWLLSAAALLSIGDSSSTHTVSFCFNRRVKRLYLTFIGAFVAGIYGLWNIYVFAILVLYAPSTDTMQATRTVELDDVADETTLFSSDTQRFITQPVNAEASLIYSIAGKGSIE